MVQAVWRQVSGLLLLMNSIPIEQNKEENLELLAAQRELYSRVKFLLALSMVLAAPFAVFWSFVAARWAGFKPLAAAWGVGIFLIDFFYLSRRQKELRKEAALIQEKFDCGVLVIPWKSLKAGAAPSMEGVLEAVQSYRRKHGKYDSLIDWYPPAVGSLPLGEARIVCQRANCVWDARLRRRYAVSAVVCVVAVILVSLGAGFLGGMRFDEFFAVVVPLAVPVLTIGLRQFSEQKDAAVASERATKHAEDLLVRIEGGAAPKPETLDKEARELQDEILDRRRQSPPIFDWIYFRLRAEQEVQMNEAASRRVKAILQARASTEG
ncbi:S-4TM family putative pore-forming effector [Corallococcus exercitus]|uniref:S-4TM family putative pore-forming effector n=1 Tax=Corallococcus exercitus TaxID=2316736 RepID=UPI001FC98535|nr:S-4TM family putative pore-forming effector [Corallococcus exercitus]